MKIWFGQTPDETGIFGPVNIGVYTCLKDFPVEGGLATAGPDTDKSALNVDVAAWLSPSGISGNTELLEGLVASGKPIMVSVNGLGTKAYAAVSAIVPPGKLINFFDTQEQDSISYLEQLVWLAAQPAPFAIMAQNTRRFVEAAAMGATHLVIPKSADIELEPIIRVVLPRATGKPRPTSAAEIDHLLGRETSLTVARTMKVGETLLLEDLSVDLTLSRGLSPTLRDRVVGRVLRYTIKPGEPLTFGHLMLEKFL